jgi:predicted AlkP superfamily phosphohydrolase/phosphomutase
MSEGRRALVIGSDGASPELIFRWAEAGVLPTFRKMLEHGTRAKLRSTIPPHSGPAWVSAITGKNPSKHGVFYFTTVNPRRAPPRIVSSDDIRTDTLFDVLGASGRSSVVVNVPITYPPWKIGGILVSGMFAPSERVVFTYPPEIGPKLVSEGYEVEFSTWETWSEVASKRRLTKEEAEEELSRRRKAYFSRAIEIDNKNAEALLSLLKGREWDFAMVMLPGLDRIQHLLWQSNTPSEEDAVGAAFGCSKYIVDAYRNLDGLVARITEAVGRDAWTIIMSDHGFGPAPRTFYVNRWLATEGFLTPAKKRGGKLGALYERGLIRTRSLLRRARTGRPLRGPDMPTFHGLLPIGSLDLPGTKAYAPTPYGLVNINASSDQDRRQIADAMTKRLEALVDPATGARVIIKVHSSGELYPGPFSDEASDLLLEPDPNYYVDNRVGGKEVLADSSRHPASHKPDGVLVLSGPDVREGFELERAHLFDVFPTVLRLLGVPLPMNLDGRPLDDALIPGGRILSEKVVYRNASGKEEISDRINRLKSQGRL